MRCNLTSSATFYVLSSCINVLGTNKFQGGFCDSPRCQSVQFTRNIEFQSPSCSIIIVIRSHEESPYECNLTESDEEVKAEAF